MGERDQLGGQAAGHTVQLLVGEVAAAVIAQGVADGFVGGLVLWRPHYGHRLGLLLHVLPEGGVEEAAGGDGGTAVGCLPLGAGGGGERYQVDEGALG